MKKILYYAIASLLTFSSCTMELEPEGSIPDDQALQTIKDYESFGIGLNTIMRRITSGDFVILSDIQLDDFNAVIGNGNRRMEFYNGQILPSTGEIASIYSGYYSAIAQTNFFLGHALVRVVDSSLTPADKATMQNYIGQAYFFRAYCYSSLADKFCESYKNCTELDREGLGLSLQLVYAPTAENDQYPARSSMRNTYNQILSDLTNAIQNLSAYETATAKELLPDATFATSDAAKALLARVYLNMGENKKAADLAEELINHRSYDLIPRSRKSDFYNMWLNDTGSEIIWKVSADYSHTGSASGAAFCNNDQNPDYVPNHEAVFLFEESDARWIAWFDTKGGAEFNITNSGGSASMYLFRKYPGNPSLQDKTSSGSNYINMPKPLRIGEMYLIAAEAYYEMNNENMAKLYLSLLEDARDARGYNSSMSGQTLLNEIRRERRRELMGEGLRLADLKRWHIGFQRSSAYDGHNNVIISINRNLSYDADDYRYVWPIPQHEIDSNPQLIGQQNRGY